jgi:hypothetical protein|tara:strand:+ start:58 stop:333 length:276 start_codon:yes stop_codon:yes gene_type:complete
MKEEWKLLSGWLILVFILLSSECTGAPNGAINIPYKPPVRYELIEPLGTKHSYREQPLVGKSYYCFIHEAPEIIWEDRGVMKVRRYTGPKW